MGALVLALVAAIALFVAEPDRAYAQAAHELGSLTVGGKQITLTSPGGTNNYDYTTPLVRVSSATGSVNVSATPSISSHRIEVRYGVGASFSYAGGGSQTLPTAGSVASSGSVPLVAASTTNIAIVVKSSADATDAEAIYGVAVQRVATGASGNAKLSALTITTPDFSLVPSPFNADTRSYTVFVPHDVDANTSGATATVDNTITVTATAADTNGVPKVTSNRGASKVADDTDNTGNIAEHVVTLDPGLNVITVMVEAENVVATETYTLSVTRANANARDDAKLSSLTVGGSSVDVPDPIADPTSAGASDVGYATRVPNATSSITVNAAKNHSGATVVLRRFAGGNTALTGANVTGWDTDDQTISLDPGLNYIAVQVTAEDGLNVNRKYYLIEVTRARSAYSDDADLMNDDGVHQLTITIDTSATTALVVPPVRGSMSYMAFVPNNVDSVTDDTNTPATLGNQVTVTAMGYANTDTTGDNVLDTANVRMSADKIGPDTADASNIATHAVTLSAGSNVITIMVESADATVTRTYTLTVRRAALNGLDDARLSALSVGGTSVNLAAFTGTAAPDTASSRTAGYTTRVPNATSSVQITATPMDSGSDGAVVVVRTGTTGDGAVTTGAVDPDGNVALTEGNTTVIAVQVTAANGTTQLNYIVSVERVRQGASNATDLSSLMVTANDDSTPATFLSALVSGTTDYMISVPNDVDGSESGDDNDDEILITAAPASGGMVRVTSDNDDVVAAGTNTNEYVVELAEGANVITIVSQAANAVDAKMYTLTVTRAAATASDNAGLSSLTVHASGDATMVYRAVSDPGAYLTNVNTTVMSTNIVETGVSNAVYNVQIDATPSNDNASVVIKSMPSSTTAPADAAAINAVSADADGVVDVVVGAGNHIVAEVTAENGVAKAYYVLKVNRARASADDGAKLSVLTTSEDPLTPAFDMDVMAYSAEVADGVDEITITATGGMAADATAGSEQGAAIVHIMSNRVDAEAYGMNTVTNHAVDLMPGTNDITIMVTAADYETTETYTITVTVPIQEPRDEATLLAMYDTNGTEGIQIDEAVQAVRDYATGALTLEEVVIIVRLYASG